MRVVLDRTPTIEQLTRAGLRHASEVRQKREGSSQFHDREGIALNANGVRRTRCGLTGCAPSAPPAGSPAFLRLTCFALIALGLMIPVRAEQPDAAVATQPDPALREGSASRAAVFSSDSAWAWGVYVVGHLAYVASGASGLLIVDIGNPAQPALLGWCDTPGYAYGVHVSGTLAYVADGPSGLQIIDVSNPAQPSIIGFYTSYVETSNVYVLGTQAYLANAGNLQIIDVSDPAMPRLLGSYDTLGDAYGVWVSGNLAYIAWAREFNGGVEIVDVSVPSLCWSRGSYSTPNRATDVFVSGGLAYVTWSYLDDNRWIEVGGLQVLDVRDPSQPQLLGSAPTPTGAYEVRTLGGLAFVAGGFSGLQIFNISDPTSVALHSSYPTPSPAMGVYPLTGLACVAAGDAGLWVLAYAPPTGDPSNLVATAASWNQINLSWHDNSSNETGFRIERKAGPTGSWLLLATVTANVTSYRDTRVGSNQTYFYRVQAVNSVGPSAFSNIVSARTPSAASVPRPAWTGYK